MRKLCVNLFSVLVAALLCTPAQADPQDSLRKLAAGMWAFQAQKKEGLPPCPLTDDEVKELTAWLGAEYRKQGQETGPEQTAMMAGGWAAALDPAAADAVLQAVVASRRGRTTLIVTHDERVTRIADRVVDIRDPRTDLVPSGTEHPTLTLERR